MALSPEEHARISAAIRAAEANTAGEIFVVVARAADPYRLVPVAWAGVIALLLPWPLAVLTALSIGTLLTLQVVAFILLAVLFSAPALRYRLVPGSVAEEEVLETARAQFLAQGVHQTQDRTGVLIFVAEAERRVEVIADAGINARVGQQDWDAVAAEVVTAAKAGRMADGLVAGVERSGRLLAAHFPRGPGDRNELRDHVVEL